MIWEYYEHEIDHKLFFQSKNRKKKQIFPAKLIFLYVSTLFNFKQHFLRFSAQHLESINTFFISWFFDCFLRALNTIAVALKSFRFLNCFFKQIFHYFILNPIKISWLHRRRHFECSQFILFFCSIACCCFCIELPCKTSKADDDVIFFLDYWSWNVWKIELNRKYFDWITGELWLHV